MIHVFFTTLEEVNEGLRSRLSEANTLIDHSIIEGETNWLLATSEREVEFEGVRQNSMEISEREHESFIALVSKEPVDFSNVAFRAYADPVTNPGLVTDKLIGDGFIIEAKTMHDIPQDTFRLARTIREGVHITRAFRMDGEPSAIMDEKILIARIGNKHPSLDLFLSAAKAGLPPFFIGPESGHVNCDITLFSIKDGAITIDDTFDQKSVEVKAL